jgi:enoyl-CoA hydratase/carnithine racemase
LPHIIGMGWAMELIVIGKRIDAREAYRIGLANEREVGQTAIFRPDIIEGPLTFAQERTGKFTND